MSECLFCKIVSGEIGADHVAEGPGWLAFRDIAPQAPTHVLIIPKEHIGSLNDLDGTRTELAGELLLGCRDVARREGIADPGYRLLTNTNREAGQLVPHLHFHLLGGREMGWPPG